VLDVERIRAQARRKMEDGARTPALGLDPKKLITVLNDVVATEVVCWTRYTRHAISATGINRTQVAAEFTEHAAAELQHAMWAAERVSQLGGEPDFDPATIAQRCPCLLFSRECFATDQRLDQVARVPARTVVNLMDAHRLAPSGRKRSFPRRAAGSPRRPRASAACAGPALPSRCTAVA